MQIVVIIVNWRGLGIDTHHELLSLLLLLLLLLLLQACGLHNQVITYEH